MSEGSHRKTTRTEIGVSIGIMIATAAGLATVINNAPTETAPTGGPVHAQFADALRVDVPTLTYGITNQQITDEAQAVCDTLAGTPLEETFRTYDFPVDTAEDAATFFAMSVVWRCPEYAADLEDLTIPGIQ